MLNVRKSRGNDTDGCISMETKLHIFLVEWKVLMLQTSPIIVRWQVPHLKHDQHYAYHREGKTKVGWVVAKG